MTCEDCKYYLEYPHKEDGRAYDGVCRWCPQYEHRKKSWWCGKFSSGKKLVTPRKKFKKPTLAEVQEYIVARRSTVNANKWMDHYESKGWQVGSGGMKDWKAAVRTWEDDTVVSSKSCVDCSTPWKEGFRFTGLGKKKKYRCPKCSDKRNN